MPERLAANLDSLVGHVDRVLRPAPAALHDLAYSSVIFGTPTANDGEASRPGAHSHLGDGTCETSHVEVRPSGVRHQMGIPRPA